MLREDRERAENPPAHALHDGVIKQRRGRLPVAHEQLQRKEVPVDPPPASRLARVKKLQAVRVSIRAVVMVIVHGGDLRVTTLRAYTAHDLRAALEEAAHARGLVRATRTALSACARAASTSNALIAALPYGVRMTERVWVAISERRATEMLARGSNVRR